MRKNLWWEWLRDFLAQESHLLDQADALRISRHALSLFNCDWFEGY